MDIGGYLAYAIAKSGITKKDLAISAGVSASYISAMTSGRKAPTLDVLEKMCKAMSMTLSAFFSGMEEMERIHLDDGLLLTAEEAEHILKLRTLSREEKRIVLSMASTLAKHKTGQDRSSISKIG